MKVSTPRLCVIIVNYKSIKLVVNSLTALLPQLDRNRDRIIVVDNDSQDESVTVLTHYISTHHLDKTVELIASSHNGGFAYGNNLAMKSALKVPHNAPEFFLLLNPDTLSQHNAIQPLLDSMAQNPKIGIAGSRLENEKAEVQCSAFRFHSILSELDSALRLNIISHLLSRWKVAIPIVDHPVQVDWVAGASMLIRTKMIQDTGLMDESYFLYFEETDFCLQAYRKGWQCWYIPQSRIIHYVGQSTGVVSGGNTRRPAYWFQSRQHYFLKNHGAAYTITADLVWLFGFSLWRLRRRIQAKPDHDPKKMLIDFWQHSLLYTGIQKVIKK